MMQKLIPVFCLFLLIQTSSSFVACKGKSVDSTFVETAVTLETKSGKIFGTLRTPKEFSKIPLVLIIAGSGPTDRNGDGPLTRNSGLKKLATELCDSKIASLRYDKRGIGESRPAMSNEINLRFDDYVNDAKDWLELLRKDKRFSKIIIVGHSEGSLIGMIAAQNADKFVSVAGAGHPADEILKTQFGSLPKESQEIIFPLLDTLKMGKTLVKVDPNLYSIFRPGIQPYMISWFKYDPATEIKKLSIPVLIIQGTSDIQVSVEDAKLLSAAVPKAKLVLIDKMNHIFRRVDGNRDANIATYSKPDLPLTEGFIKAIAEFILKD